MLAPTIFVVLLVVRMGSTASNDTHSQINGTVVLKASMKSIFDIWNGFRCVYDCPKGWYRLAGFNGQCFWFPPQPPQPASFWEWQRRCREMDPEANILVLNGIGEEAKMTAVAMNYAANWPPAGSSGLMWLGGYTDQSGWKFLDDCIDCNTSPLFVLSSVVGSEKNNTCLAIDIKVPSGEWLTKPCSDAIGIAFCETPLRELCGKDKPTALSLVPMVPIDVSPSGLASLLPKIPSIPYIEQILPWSTSGTDSALDKMLSCFDGIHDDTCKLPLSKLPLDRDVPDPTPLPDGCRWECPDGWRSWNTVNPGRCYHFPEEADSPVGSFWDMEAYCQGLDASAHLSVMADLLDQAAVTAMAAKIWQRYRPDGFLWLGAYTTNLQWKLVNGGDVRSILQMAMANLPSRLDGTFRNGTCLTADLATAGKWSQAPCNKPGGLAVCEMPKKANCEDDITISRGLDFPPDWLTVERLKRLFPASPEIPFLTEAIAARIQNNFNSTINTAATETREIFCVKKAAKLTPTDVNPRPEWDWLDANGKRATATGTLSIAKCGPSAKSVIWVLEVDPQVYLDAWTRCYNDGWEVAMVEPGWTPFMVNKKVAEHYRENSSSKFGIRGNDKLEGFTKVGMIDPSKC